MKHNGRPGLWKPGSRKPGVLGPNLGLFQDRGASQHVQASGAAGPAASRARDIRRDQELDQSAIGNLAMHQGGKPGTFFASDDLPEKRTSAELCCRSSRRRDIGTKTVFHPGLAGSCERYLRPRRLAAVRLQPGRVCGGTGSWEKPPTELTQSQPRATSRSWCEGMPTFLGDRLLGSFARLGRSRAL